MAPRSPERYTEAETTLRPELELDVSVRNLKAANTHCQGQSRWG
jgi:hypothetical protein